MHVFLGQKPLKNVKIGDEQSKLLIATISSKKSNFKILIYTASNIKINIAGRERQSGAKSSLLRKHHNDKELTRTDSKFELLALGYHMGSTTLLYINPFTTEAPVTARADPRPFYHL